MDELRDIYKSKIPSLGRAKKKLESILKEVVKTIENRSLVRADPPIVRIKALPSLQLKSESNGWCAGEALWRCRDLIGGRVVCNNIEDVYRLCELLKERLPSSLSDLGNNFDVRDYIEEPSEKGYRALHLYFRLNTSERPFRFDLVPCEVQIRTRLQDAWAELSHDDIYKQIKLPEDLRARSKDLAEVLSAADKIASGIRSRAVQETSLPDHRPDWRKVSEEGLAYSFREMFGRSPANYAVRLALNLCERLRISSLEKLSKQLVKPGFRESISEKYQAILNVGIANEDFFLAALYATARGNDQALGWIQQKARRERRDLENFARQEAMSSLPDNIDTFVQVLEDLRSDTCAEDWARALGTTSNCALCGTLLVDSYSLAEAAVRHYKVPESEADDLLERLETTIESSGIETGEGLLCKYHYERMMKDD